MVFLSLVVSFCWRDLAKYTRQARTRWTHNLLIKLQNIQHDSEARTAKYSNEKEENNFPILQSYHPSNHLFIIIIRSQSILSLFLNACQHMRSALDSTLIAHHKQAIKRQPFIQSISTTNCNTPGFGSAKMTRIVVWVSDFWFVVFEKEKWPRLLRSQQMSVFPRPFCLALASRLCTRWTLSKFSCR